jgi:putative FmdB family regulatory protein
MTYEYVCTACGHEWEAEQPISAEPLKKCPSCNRAKAKRQISGGAGFILKGGGWYADGYGSSRTPKGSTESKPSDSKASDSKPSDKSKEPAKKKTESKSKSGAAAA